MEKVKIVDYPPIFLYDTPGILPPTIYNVEVGMRLALFDYVKPTVDVEIIADYLLFMLNKCSMFHYVTHYGLEAVTDNIAELLDQICHNNNMTVRVNSAKLVSVNAPDWHGASLMFLADFRKGNLGKFSFDLATDPVLTEVTTYVPESLTQTESRVTNFEDEESTQISTNGEMSHRLIGDVSHLIDARWMVVSHWCDLTRFHILVHSSKLISSDLSFSIF